MNRLWQFLKFAGVGTSGMFVDLGCYALLLTACPPAVARGLAIWVAMTWNFGWNRRYTFAGTAPAPLLPQYLTYCLSCCLGAVVNWSVSLLLVQLHPWFREHPVAAALPGVAAGLVFNYSLCALFVFRRSVPADGESAAARPANLSLHRTARCG